MTNAERLWLGEPVAHVVAHEEQVWARYRRRRDLDALREVERRRCRRI